MNSPQMARMAMMALTIADTHWATFPVSTVNYSNITSDRNADAVQKSCFGNGWFSNRTHHLTIATIAPVRSPVIR
jgi:hypothetical protein